MYGDENENSVRFNNPYIIMYIILGVILGAVCIYYITRYKVITYD
jgi:hypothetical protein